MFKSSEQLEGGVQWVERTWGSPANKRKSGQCREDESWKPIPYKATAKDIEEEPVSGDLPTICFDIDTAMQGLKEGSIGKRRRPDLAQNISEWISREWF